MAADQEPGEDSLRRVLGRGRGLRGAGWGMLAAGGAADKWAVHGALSPGAREAGEEPGPYHRLTGAELAEMCRRYAVGGVTQEQLAAEYGVHRSTVNRALRGGAGG